MKIVVTENQDFTNEQKERLDSLGEVTYYDPLSANASEYLERVKGADIICSGTAGLKDAYMELKEVYVTVSFVSVAFVDLEVLKQNNVQISNTPGVNQHPVSEWIVWAMIEASRNFNKYLNSTELIRKDGNTPTPMPGLAKRNVTILGHGSIGKRVAKIAVEFDMNVSFFRRGDNLNESVKDADIVVDTLSSNPSTQNLLNGSFFSAMKRGSTFISVTRSEIHDTEALLAAIDRGHLSGAIMDCAGILVGDTEDEYYQKLLAHSKVQVTPHIAYSSEMGRTLGCDVMIDNVEAYINGKPQNVLN